MKVFVSSTYKDLSEHRERVTTTLQRMQLQYSAMEFFGSRTDEAMPVSKAEIEACDLFVGIYAHCYGWVPDGSEVSITEAEFDHAQAHDRPCLCYVVDPDASWNLNLVDWPDSPAGSKLARFKAKVNKLVRSQFTTPDNLAAQIAADLAREMGAAPPAETLAEYGVIGVWDPLRGESIHDRLAGAKELVIVKTWFPEDNRIGRGFKRALENGAKVRLLLCDPDSATLRVRAIGARKNPEQVSRWVVDAVRLVRSAVHAEQTSHFEVGIFDQWPGCPVIHVDGRIYMGFYFCGDSSPNYRWLVVDPISTLADILSEQESQLWLGATKLLTLDALDEWICGHPLPPLYKFDTE